jgi:D-lactate dehydrogenase (cytochrome)
MDAFIKQCQLCIGKENVLLDEFDKSPFLTEWRQRATGKALAVLKPGSTPEVAELVKLCQQFSIKIVPQGGNTGLVLGSIPTDAQPTVVLSLLRLNRIRQIDDQNQTITVEAGCLLAQTQDAAAQHGQLFPLSLASEGSCTIGGNLATNAGGTAVLRYGNMRELCLGLEVVTAQGEIWNGLRGLRKDNTGYDLRDLFIGSEGTLGIITAAVLKLFPQPQAQLTALIAVDNISDAVKFLNLTKFQFQAMLTGFELMNAYSTQLVYQHFTHIQKVFHNNSPYYVLVELSSSDAIEYLNAKFESLIADNIESGLIQDAVIANSIAHSKNLWWTRELISSAQAKEGKNIKHDISLPISKLAEFVQVTDQLLQEHFDGCRMVTFGHLGDGNLHYNISAPINADQTTFLNYQQQINQLVHDQVHHFNGSISAEHGIGFLKREEMLRYKSVVEMNLMINIKNALDPDNLMNPNKLIKDRK